MTTPDAARRESRKSLGGDWERRALDLWDALDACREDAQTTYSAGYRDAFAFVADMIADGASLGAVRDWVTPFDPTKP